MSNMNGEKEIPSRDVVTSVGNTWVIGRSKRYHGRLYYFDTLTGKSAWNLSESEMAKAKSSQHQQDVLAINCPEPQEPPVDIVVQQQRNSIPSKIYNKQIINNQITRDPFISTSTSWSNCVLESPGNQITGFNPNVWAIPPIHQFILTPTASTNLMSTMGIQQPQINLDSQNESPPRPPYKHNSNFKHKGFSYRCNGRNNNLGKRRGNLYYNNRRIQNSPDLRQVLTARRNLQHMCNKRNLNFETSKHDSSFQSDPEADASTLTESEIDNHDYLYPSDVDEEWLEDNTHYQGTKPVLNVSALSRLASKDGDSKCWYIVVDGSTLRNHLDFLTVLLNSDSDCVIVVQRATMTELRQGTVSPNPRLKKRSRRALCFLSQQINSESAFIDDHHTTEDCVFGPKHQPLSCCILLSKKLNQNIILLTNDEDLLEYKSHVTFPIFTVNEIKRILEAKYSDVQVQYPEQDGLSITIPTDVVEVVDIKMSPPGKSCDQFSNQDEHILPSTSTMTTNSTTVSKNTVDAEVQTECLKEKEDATKMLEVTNDTNVEEITSNSTELAKNKETCLKRVASTENVNTDSQTNKTNKAKENRLKWNRKKNIKKSSASSDSSSRLAIDKDSSTKSCNMTQDNISASDTVGNSDTSSCITSRHNIDKQVIVEETSTSGVISNSIRSESLSSLPQADATFSSFDENNENVMFEITSPFMEEHLRRNSDEWISRFLQIMEEVLSQVLRQEPAFVHPKMPPPWTAQEAVECTKRKFSTHRDVVDACNKLSQVFFKLSDIKGNIARNMHPAKFMEMYSYGVYLVDSLVSIQDSEDLQTSTESLTKLLSDIQDPNLDTMKDSFTDNMNDLSLNVQELPVTPTKPSSINEEDMTRTPQSLSYALSSSPKSDSTGNRYSLRSATKTTAAETEKPQEVKFIRTCDHQSTFSLNLKLQKNKNNDANTSTEIHVDPNNVEENTNSVNSSNNVSTDKAEPKIIRNFSQCLEYENRLKNKSRAEVDLDEQYFYEEEVDDSDEGYLANNAYFHDLQDINSGPHAPDQQLESEMDSFLPGNSNDQTVSGDIDDQDAFKWFIAAIWCEIKLVISKIHTFCVNTIQYLQDSSQLSLTKNIEIREQAEKARKDLYNLCTALASIHSNNRSELNMETEGPDNLKESLRYLGIDINEDIAMNDEQLGKYREMVSKCTDQAGILLTSLSLIINAINK